MPSFLKKSLVEKDGIFSFPIDDDKTKKVVEFYKVSPFPNYKNNDDRETIIEKGDKNILAYQFKKFIGHNKKVLEVGCGTGQLSIYFAIGTNNEIVAIDPTINSINLAQNFAIKNKITNINYVNSDIFDEVISENYFDFVWCNGVLHHTKNPYKGFEITCRSLKKNGYILIGLYNKYGRIRTLMRKYLAKFFGEKILNFLDPTLRHLKLSDVEKK